MTVPRAALDHLGDDRLDEHDGREHVGLEVVAQDAHRRVEDEVHVPRPHVAAVVHQHVDVAPFGEHRVGGRDQRRVVEQVAGTVRHCCPAARISSAVVSSEPGSALVSDRLRVELCSRASPSCTVRAVMATS